MTLYKALTRFIQVWVGLVFLSNVTAVLFGFLIASRLFAYSPFVYELVLLSPALAAFFVRDFVKNR